MSKKKIINLLLSLSCVSLILMLSIGISASQTVMAKDKVKQQET